MTPAARKPDTTKVIRPTMLLDDRLVSDITIAMGFEKFRVIHQMFSDSRQFALIIHARKAV